MSNGSRLAETLRRAAALALAVALATPVSLHAQYFGRQKVQYETFNFQVMETEHFDIYFYPEADLAMRDKARMAERWRERLSNILRHDLPRQPIVLYADHPDFQQTNVVGGMIGEGTGGITESLKNRVVMPLTGVYANTDHVLGHEIVHAFQYDMSQRQGAGGLAGLTRLPLWLIEGMAEYLSLGRQDAHTAMWLRDAVLRDDIPTIRQLTRDPRYFPYRYGQALWAYIGGRWGDDVIPELFRASVRLGLDQAITRVLGVTPDSLSAQWAASIRATYQPLVEGRLPPTEAGTRILGDPGELGEMNLSPVISPDGRFVAFFGRRSLFTVDLFLADAQTGRIIRRLASPATDQHFDALSFLYSAGSFSPDGRRLAFIVIAQGTHQLAILDVEQGRVERQIRVRGVGAISDPAWSPDGRSIAFAGSSGGLSNLYIMDVENETVRQITSDRHAVLQPAWSPDGGTIAFSTDRGPETDFDRLTYGPMRIAFYDVASGQIRLSEGLPPGKQINPQYSPDGAHLYFISGRNGYSDIHRLTLATGEIRQVTRLATGVTGISHLSPALSVARETGRLVFSVFHNSGHLIYGLEPEQAEGQLLDPGTPPLAAQLLPPAISPQQGVVGGYLADVDGGLPPNRDFPVRPYRPRLELDMVGGAIQAGNFGQFGGAAAGGGIGAYFSDMLGNRIVGVGIEGGGDIRDIGASAVFQNIRRRWNWGVGAGRSPYLQGFSRLAVDPATGAMVIESRLQRIFVDQLMTMAQYPFATTRRFETQLSFTRVSYDFEVERLFLNQFGQVFDRQVESLDAPPAVGYGQFSGALVGDNSFFGFTSPVIGQRYRLEAGPTFGNLTFVNALADYRRYFFRNPLTLAFRGMHFGRYGRDGEDQRLTPLFLGYPTLIRGYSYESFGAADCTSGAATSECPEFDRLIGSRIGVANAELRLPLFGSDELGIFTTRFLPIELAAFVDAGVAWRSDQRPDLRFDRESIDRIPVVSAGASTRLNLFGYAVVEIYYAVPFQRPARSGGLWGFHVAPGW